jgi:hypothetical protein
MWALWSCSPAVQPYVAAVALLWTAAQLQVRGGNRKARVNDTHSLSASPPPQTPHTHTGPTAPPAAAAASVCQRPRRQHTHAGCAARIHSLRGEGGLCTVCCPLHGVTHHGVISCDFYCCWWWLYIPGRIRVVARSLHAMLSVKVVSLPATVYALPCRHHKWTTAMTTPRLSLTVVQSRVRG